MDYPVMGETQREEVGCNHRVGMVIDDDELVRESVAEILEDVCDEVYAAADGVEALEVLDQHPDIAVVVTDISMPRLDGIGFADQARQRRPELKVLFVSGLQQPPVSESFLRKPFMRGSLVSAVESLLAA